jgi:alkylation response protein AidB-like acyl-CoA dehydrogenase
VAELCARFGEDYWKDLDTARGYPTEFVAAMTRAGYLTVLIPEEYGGGGGTLLEACAVLEEISRRGAHAGACHAQMYLMRAVLRHGTDAQKRAVLPSIADGSLRLQSFAVTEPNAGTDTTSIETTAVLDGDIYLVNGQKIWTSRVEHSDLMILLARTAPRDPAAKTEGLTTFLVDLRDVVGHGLEIRPIDASINHHTAELFFDDLRLPADSVLGQPGGGWQVVLDGMNAERILIAAECVGDARYFLDKAAAYATTREVFGRPIGMNQGIQFPLARAHADTEAAALMVERAADLFESGKPCGLEANMAKLLAADASWKAGDAAMQTHGGFAFAREYHLERKFRETRLYQIAPISTNLILSYIAERALGLPRSF